MGKHVSKNNKIAFKLNDSLIIILAVVATAVMGHFVSAALILVLHQIFMFFSHKTIGDAYSLPNSGYNTTRKVYTYITYGLLAFAVVVAVLVPLKTHEWKSCGQIAVVLALLACQNGIFDSMDYSLYKGARNIEDAGVSFYDYDTVLRLGKVKSLIMNKTGTITENQYNLAGIFPKTITENQFLGLVLKLESLSKHPISTALGCGINADNEVSIEEIEGKGIVGTYSGNTILVGNARLLYDYQIKCDVPEIYGTAVHLAVNSDYCGYMVFENKTRAGTFDYIEQIRDTGVDYMYILSNDLQSVVQPISQALGINVCKAEMDTDSKCSTTDYIVSNKQEDSFVAYAGNSNEYIPGMHAEVFISLGDGNEGDVCIAEEGIAKLPELFRQSKRIIRINRINLYISVISRILILCLLILGVKTAVPASVILFISSMFTFVDLDERIRL